jgi:hypothetical protein
MLQTAKRSHSWRGGSAAWGIVISQNEMDHKRIKGKQVQW